MTRSNTESALTEIIMMQNRCKCNKQKILGSQSLTEKHHLFGVNPQLSLMKLRAIKFFLLKDSAENRNPSEHEMHIFSLWVLSVWGEQQNKKKPHLI